MGDDQLMLTEQEAAKFVGVTVHALRAWRWRKQDGPTYLKLGSCVRYLRRDLEARIESHRVVNSVKTSTTQRHRRRRARRAA
jgi:hypothetical protein